MRRRKRVKGKCLYRWGKSKESTKSLIRRNCWRGSLVATRRNSMWVETTVTGWKMTSLDATSAGLTEGTVVDRGGSGTLSMSRSDLGQEVSQP